MTDDADVDNGGVDIDSDGDDDSPDSDVDIDVDSDGDDDSPDSDDDTGIMYLGEMVTEYGTACGCTPLCLAASRHIIYNRGELLLLPLLLPILLLLLLLLDTSYTTREN